MAADWLPWAPVGTALLHISGELIFPGGFAGVSPLSSQRIPGQTAALVHHQIPR